MLEGVTRQDPMSGKQYGLSVSGTNWTTTRAVGIPYIVVDELGNEIWRFKFNIRGITSAGAAELTLTITGVVFKSDGTFRQAIATHTEHATQTNQMVRSWATNGLGTLYLDPNYSATEWGASGDVELNAKPTL